MERIREVCTTPFLRKCGFVLSCLTVVVGAIALFSNHWVEGGEMHAGFINACSNGMCMSVHDQLPVELKTAYVFGVMVLIYMPLVMVFVAAVLQGITVWRGPSKRRDLGAIICAWLSTYHGILLVVIMIAAAKMSTFPTQAPEEPPYQSSWMSTTQLSVEDQMYSETRSSQASPADWATGWSADVGLFALILGLLSAIITSVYSGNDDKPRNDDNIPLDEDYA